MELSDLSRGARLAHTANKPAAEEGCTPGIEGKSNFDSWADCLLPEPPAQNHAAGSSDMLKMVFLAL